MRNKKFIIAGIILLPISIFYVLILTIDLSPVEAPGGIYYREYIGYRIGQIVFAVLVAVGAVCLGYGLTHRK